MAAITIPRGELGYAELSADFNTTNAGATDVPGLSVTVTVGTRPIVVRFYGLVHQLTSGNETTVSLAESGGASDITDFRFKSPAADYYTGGYFEARLTPAAGAHTYKVQLASGSGTSAGIATNGGTQRPHLQVIEV